MLNKIISFFAKKALSGKVVSAVAWIHNILDGKRSEIVIVLIAAVYGLKIAQIVPDAVAGTFRQTFAEKGQVVNEHCPFMHSVLSGHIAARVEGRVARVGIPGVGHAHVSAARHALRVVKDFRYIVL